MNNIITVNLISMVEWTNTLIEIAKKGNFLLYINCISINTSLKKWETGLLSKENKIYKL